MLHVHIDLAILGHHIARTVPHLQRLHGVLKGHSGVRINHGHFSIRGANEKTLAISSSLIRYSPDLTAALSPRLLSGQLEEDLKDVEDSVNGILVLMRAAYGEESQPAIRAEEVWAAYSGSGGHRKGSGDLALR